VRTGGNLKVRNSSPAIVNILFLFCSFLQYIDPYIPIPTHQHVGHNFSRLDFDYLASLKTTRQTLLSSLRIPEVNISSFKMGSRLTFSGKP
jgi:hypothetical protein